MCNETYESCNETCYYLYDSGTDISDCQRDCYFDREDCDNCREYTEAS